MARILRLAAVSSVPVMHDHRDEGVDLDGIRDLIKRIIKQKPDFICFPEACACIGGGLARGVKQAPDLEPFAASVGKLAKEFDVALVVPFLERYQGQVYNSVPIIDRAGKLVLTYRKNYPTIGEMEAGITPGWEVPVAECDGVRVGAAVCFDVNFADVAEKLEKQRARIVFWPSMFWGGSLLQHWALRYGFVVVASYAAESAIIDMDGRFLVKQGQETPQVKGKRLPPWAVAPVNVDRELFHLDYNQDKFQALQEKHGPDIEIEVHQPEAFFHLASVKQGLTVEQIAKEFKLETLRDYLARSRQQREERLRGHAGEKGKTNEGKDR